MKYTKEERLDIGRRIYDGELSRYQAAKVNNPAGMTPLFQPEETAIPIHGNRYSSSRTPPFQL